MSRKELAISITIGVAYALLLFIFIIYASGFSFPSWWFPTFGQNIYSAYSWLHLTHSAGVLVAAIPIAGVLVYRFWPIRFKMTLVAAAVPTAMMLFITIRGYYQMAQIGGVEIRQFGVISSLLDVSKISIILLLVVALLSYMMPSNKALNSDAAEPRRLI